MNAHEPGPNLLTVAREAFRQAIEQHIDTSDNLDDIKSTYYTLMDERWDEGDVIVTGREVVRLVKDHTWTVLNSRAGQRTGQHLRRLARGEVPLAEVDDFLDEPITVGENRRSTLRHLNVLDIKRMLDERRNNLAKQEKAFLEFQDSTAAVQDWITRFGSIPAAIKSGEVQLAEIA